MALPKLNHFNLLSDNQLDQSSRTYLGPIVLMSSERYAFGWHSIFIHTDR